MPKSEKGSVLIILVLFFAATVLTIAFFVYKTLTNSTKKIAQQSEVIQIALKNEYENPFEETTQYQNPFDEYHNPFDDIK
jgi:hypothetical protein